MIAAAWPSGAPETTRLLHVDPVSGALRGGHAADLLALLAPADVLVVNDAATLPASLLARTRAGEPVEVRLLAARGERSWTAVLFGAGDWRTPTEHRPEPPRVAAGDPLLFGPDLSAVVTGVLPLSPRLVELELDRGGAELWSALYRLGRPVQYSYVRAPLALRHVQTTFASRPWAVEPPSAARPLTWGLLAALRRRGVRIAALTHAAGLSSTGDPALDAALPLPERYDVPRETVEAVLATWGAGGRVVAVGTTVVRALEACAAEHGQLRPGAGVAELRIDAAHPRRVVDGILTGLHEPGASHFALLGAFAPVALLERAWAWAEVEGWLAHEFGDAMLVLPSRHSTRLSSTSARASVLARHPDVGDDRPRPAPLQGHAHGLARVVVVLDEQDRDPVQALQAHASAPLPAF